MPKHVNNSKVDVIVKEVIEWQSGHSLSHDLGSDFTAQSTFKPTPLPKQMLIGPQEGSSSRYTRGYTFRAIERSENRVLLSIPSSAYNSYNGGLIKVRQRLEIKVHTSGGLNSKGFL